MWTRQSYDHNIWLNQITYFTKAKYYSKTNHDKVECFDHIVMLGIRCTFSRVVNKNGTQKQQQKNQKKSHMIGVHFIYDFPIFFQT